MWTTYTPFKERRCADSMLRRIFKSSPPLRTFESATPYLESDQSAMPTSEDSSL